MKKNQLIKLPLYIIRAWAVMIAAFSLVVSLIYLIKLMLNGLR